MSAPLVDLLLILIHPITLALAALVVALRSRRNFIAYLVVVSLAVAHLFYYFSEIGSWYTYGFWDVWEEYWNDSFLIVWNWETRAAWLAVGLSIVIVVLNLGAELSRGALSVGPAISSLDQLTSGSQSAAQQRRARFARKIRFTLLSLIA